MENKNGNGQLRTFAEELGMGLLNEIKELRNQHDQDIYDEGFEKGRKFAIQSSISALIELGIPEIKIYHILKEYHGINTISEAESIIYRAKVDYKKYAVEEYLIKEGYDFRERTAILRRIDLKRAFESDPSLLDLSPEKIVRKLDRE